MIDLLPEEMRGREKKQKSKNEDLELTIPEKESESEKNDIFKKPILKPTFFGRLFSSKKTQQKKNKNKNNFEKKPTVSISDKSDKKIQKEIKNNNNKITKDKFKKENSKQHKKDKNKNSRSLTAGLLALFHRPKVKIISQSPIEKKSSNNKSDDKKSAPKKSEIKDDINQKKQKNDYYKPAVSINLVPEELAHSLSFGRNKTIFLASATFAASLIIIFGAYFTLKYWQASTSRRIEDKTQKIELMAQSLKKYQQVRNKTLLLQKRLLLVEDLLRNKPLWSKFLSDLEKYTLNSVRFNNFSGDIDGSISFDATAVNYETAARQISFMEQAPFVASSKVNSLKLKNDKSGSMEVVFEFNIVLKKDYFKK